MATVAIEVKLNKKNADVIKGYAEALTGKGKAKQEDVTVTGIDGTEVTGTIKGVQGEAGAEEVLLFINQA